MSAADQHFERGQLLYQHRRFDEAEKAFRAALTDDPEMANASSFLAMALAAQDRLRDAIKEAQHAVGMAPTEAFTHFVLAHVLNQADRLPEARRAIDEAMALDPENADYWAMRASIDVQEKKWADAIAACRQGLSVEPDNEQCLNLLSLSQVHSGKQAEARETFEAALQHDPENAFTHANIGWSHLREGQHKKALVSFKEALRIDPTLDYARSGIVEALKARNIIYALFLKYALWIGSLSSTVQMAIVFGGYFGHRILRNVARDNPSLSPWILPVSILYIGFVVLTWVADPLFNLLLRLNRHGRLALDDDQTTAANRFGITAFIGLAFLGFGLLTGQTWPLWSAGALAFLLIVVSSIHKCDKGWPRATLTLFAIVEALTIFSYSVYCLSFGGDAARDNLFLLGMLPLAIAPWLVNGLMMVRVRRG